MGQGWVGGRLGCRRVKSGLGVRYVLHGVMNESWCIGVAGGGGVAGGWGCSRQPWRRCGQDSGWGVLERGSTGDVF